MEITRSNFTKQLSQEIYKYVGFKVSDFKFICPLDENNEEHKAYQIYHEKDGIIKTLHEVYENGKPETWLFEMPSGLTAKTIVFDIRSKIKEINEI